MKRVCSVDGEEVGYEHIVKGYEYEKDPLRDPHGRRLRGDPGRILRAIDIQQFVDLEEIDPMLYKKSYYLVPEETGAKAYALLREALNQANKVGIAKVSFRDKEHLAALRFSDDAFVLETMYWPDEIREADFGGVDVDGKPRANELEMAQTIDNPRHPGTPTSSRTSTASRSCGSSRPRSTARSRGRRGRARGQGRGPDGGPEGVGRGRRQGGQDQGRPQEEDDRSQVHRQVDQEGLALARRPSESDRALRIGGMKLVTAIVKPHRLDEVKDLPADRGERTHDHGRRGVRRQRGHTEVYRGAEYQAGLRPQGARRGRGRRRDVQGVVDAIVKAARTGKHRRRRQALGDRWSSSSGSGRARWVRTRSRLRGRRGRSRRGAPRRVRLPRARVLAGPPRYGRRAGADLVDAAIGELFARAGAPPGTAVAAVGGFGRRLLLPRSDIDVLLLHDATDEPGVALADALLYPLWNAGFEVGHAVRTVEDCERACDRLDAAAAMLDMRGIAGAGGPRRLGAGHGVGARRSLGVRDCPPRRRRAPAGAFRLRLALLEPELKEGSAAGGTSIRSGCSRPRSGAPWMRRDSSAAASAKRSRPRRSS